MEDIMKIARSFSELERRLDRIEERTRELEKAADKLRMLVKPERPRGESERSSGGSPMGNADPMLPGEGIEAG